MTYVSDECSATRVLSAIHWARIVCWLGDNSRLLGFIAIKGMSIGSAAVSRPLIHTLLQVLHTHLIRRTNRPPCRVHDVSPRVTFSRLKILATVCLSVRCMARRYLCDHSGQKCAKTCSRCISRPWGIKPKSPSNRDQGLRRSPRGSFAQG